MPVATSEVSKDKVKTEAVRLEIAMSPAPKFLIEKGPFKPKDKRIELTAKEFALLELLMRRHGEVLPRSLIASQVWDMNFDSDTNVIEVAMRRLRAKVDEGFEPRLIQTVRGMGYVLEVPEPAL